MVRSLAILITLTIATPALAGSWGKPGADSWSKPHTQAKASEVTVGKRLSVGDPVVVGDLALYPVIDRDATLRPELEAIPLADAMASGLMEVREVHNGVVSQVSMINHGEDPVLVMAGDVIQGGMQDRVVIESQLVASSAPVQIPVHCVERGRWHTTRGDHFAYGGRVDLMLRQVVQRAASQEATWAAVARANVARGLPGSASWLQGAGVSMEQVAQLEGALRRRFEDDKRVVGVVVARNGRFEGRDVYGHPALFAQDRLNVLRSHLAGGQPRDQAVVASAAIPTAHDAAALLEGSLF